MLVANARHIKAVPGRKTDVKDAEWIADLLRHGLIRGSAIPSRVRRELRELVRRLSLGRQRAQVAHRIHKVGRFSSPARGLLVIDVNRQSFLYTQVTGAFAAYGMFTY